MSYSKEELQAKKKADLIDIIQEGEDRIDELVPNRRRKGRRDIKEMETLKKNDLIDIVLKDQLDISKIEAAQTGEEAAHGLEAYGRKGLTADEVEKLQQDKMM